MVLGPKCLTGGSNGLFRAQGDPLRRTVLADPMKPNKSRFAKPGIIYVWRW